MNKNKIIFAVLWVLVLIAIIYIVMLINGSTKLAQQPNKTTTGTFNIWIVEDEKEKFNELINLFKQKNKAFAGINFVVESFSNYEEYFYTLQSAIIAGKAPDIFVLNNNEKTIFEEQISGLDPTLINPQNFRKDFKQFFWDDLIRTTKIQNPEDKKEQVVEFLAWVPVWYETLWIFYNRRYVESKDVSSWSVIASATKSIKERNSDVIPIALGNGSTVPYSSDILTQFFMLNGINTINETDGNKMKEWLSTYLSYGDTEGENAYNAKLMELVNSWKNGLDLFSKDEVAMIIWYPRMIKDINEKGFKKTFLLASPFPHYYISDGKSLVNYNYFVVNKNTKNFPLATTFLSYLASEEWENAYLNAYPYYLPALVKLEEKRLGEKISPNFNIVLKDFYNPDFIFSSFDKWLKVLYDTEVSNILDDTSNAINSFDTFKNILLCKYNKIVKFEKLSFVCK
jgi:ABC-type glycerol-3-phosphate transport system substrate-binding protein